MVNDGLEILVYIGSAQNTNSPKYLVAAHQTLGRTNVPNETNNTAIFDNLVVRKYFVEIYKQRFPKDAVMTNYDVSDYFDRYRDLKIFCKKYRREELSNPFIPYPDMKSKYFPKNDLRHQVDHITPKLFRLRQIEMKSDGNKITEIKVI